MPKAINLTLRGRRSPPPPPHARSSAPPACAGRACRGAGRRRAGTGARSRRARPSRTPGSAGCRRGRGTTRSAPRLMPNSCGSGTGEPVAPPPHVPLWKPKLTIATAAASVTTARPRRARAAPTPPSRARARTAAATPASGASGKPIPASTARCETVKPATPASASCTTEIWPTKPVMTTSDSAITMPISEFVSAWRKSNGSTTSAIAHRTADGIASASGVLRARHVGEPLLDELAARRQRRAAQEHRRDDEQEDEQLLDARQRRALAGREPRLRRRVARSATEHPDAEAARMRSRTR